MLFVLNKERILSYVVAFSTVAILLGISVVRTKDSNTVETLSNYTNNATVINME